MIKYDLFRINIEVEIYAYEHMYKFILFATHDNYSQLILRKVESSKLIEIMVGIERYKGREIFEKIYKYISNLSKSDARQIKIKHKAQTFNI